MTDDYKTAPKVDDLLKLVCADDLPEDFAAAMRGRIEAFKAERETDERRAPSRVFFLPKFAWAALAILMLLTGALLQGARISSPLADRISSVKTAYASLEPIRR